MFDFEYREAEFRALEDAMRELDQVVAARIKGEGCAAMAQVAVRKAKELCPERTGALKRSIRRRRIGERYRGVRLPGLASRIFMGGKGAAHATLVHYGTVRTQANPFIINAIRDTASEQQQAFFAGCRKAWDTYVPGLARRAASRSFTASVTR